MNQRIPWILIPLALLAGCSSAGHEAVAVGGAVARDEAAHSVAQAAANARREGAEVVVQSGDAELRAPAAAVAADGSRLVRSEIDDTATVEQAVQLIKAACQVNDILELYGTDDAQGAAVKAAGIAGFEPATVYATALDLHAARSSGDRVQIVAAYALCEYAGAHP
jgi:hypothetical protein